jgi:acyl carrier protein
MTRDEIFSVIKSNIHTIIEGVDGKEIQEADSMRDFGADSLEIVEVVSRSMKQLKIKVPRTQLVDVQNLKGLVDMFEQAAANNGAR